MADTIARRSSTMNRETECVPVWVPDPGDPLGLEGTWHLIDPRSARLDPRLAAQARAVARLWSGPPVRDVA